MKKDFIVTSQIKKHIFIDSINNQFKIPKHKLIELFIKPKIHSFSEIKDVELLEDEDVKVKSFLFFSRFEYYATEIEVMVILKDDTKYYIDLINKPINKGSRAYKKAYKEAMNIVTTLNFMKNASGIIRSRKGNPNNTFIPRTLVTE